MKRKTSNKHRLGREHERAAAAYLHKRGFTILLQNVRGRGYEIDIIAKRKDALYFVEVKYRRNFAGSAWQMEQLGVQNKRGPMQRGARAYLNGTSTRSTEIVFVLFVINAAREVWVTKIG